MTLHDRRGTIFVVEDDRDLREAIGLVLVSQGFGVCLAGDGMSALERLRAGEPVDLLLVDLLLPRMDGWDLCAAVRALPGHAETPVVLLSGAWNLNRPRSSGVHAAAHVMKPVDFSKLVAILDGVLARMRASASEAAVPARAAG